LFHLDLEVPEIRGQSLLTMVYITLHCSHRIDLFGRVISL